VTGTAVLVTGLTLALGVLTWVFSALQFQADMGLLLAFMLFFNMVGALLLLPAIARLLFPSGRGPKVASEPVEPGGLVFGQRRIWRLYVTRPLNPAILWSTMAGIFPLGFTAR
jgi:uncharacterized membrane protein YdfJ with MMPL/SSD domain